VILPHLEEYGHYHRHQLLRDADAARLRRQATRRQRNLLRAVLGEALIRLGWWLKGEPAPQRAGSPGR